MPNGNQPADPFRQDAELNPGPAPYHPVVWNKQQTATSGNTGIVLASGEQPVQPGVSTVGPFAAKGWQPTQNTAGNAQPEITASPF